MPVSVVTASTSNKLTTLTNLKRELDISSTADDSYLEHLIQVSSDFIERWTGRKFAQERVNEKLPSFGGVKLMVTRTPVSTVHFIEFDGSSVSTTEYTLDNSSAGVIFRESGWTNTIITTNFITRRSIHEGRRDWEVEYTAGYILPTTSTGSTETRDLPRDLEWACIQLAKTWFLSREDNLRVVEQWTGEARELYYDTVENSGTIPPAVRDVLNQWRRIF